MKRTTSRVSTRATRKTPAVTSRGAAPPRARLRHILDQSLKCFAEQGFERATYDDLIRRAQVSRGSFYWYFPSKDALYEAVLEYAVAGYAERIEAAFRNTRAQDHIVKRLLDAFLADFNENRARYSLLLWPPPTRAAVEKLARWNDDAIAFIRKKIEPLVKDGRLDAEIAEALPNAFSALVDGLCVRLVLRDEGNLSRLSQNLETVLCRVVGDGRRVARARAPRPPHPELGA